MLRDEGYEIKNGKHTVIRGEGQQRFIRIDSLGDGYTEAELISQIEGGNPQEKKSDRPHQKKKRDFEYLIDIQKKFSCSKVIFMATPVIMIRGTIENVN